MRKTEYRHVCDRCRGKWYTSIRLKRSGAERFFTGMGNAGVRLEASGKRINATGNRLSGRGGMAASQELRADKLDRQLRPDRDSKNCPHCGSQSFTEEPVAVNQNATSATPPETGQSQREDSNDPSLRCASCGTEYIAGTVLCADCMGTDVRPIAEPVAVASVPDKLRQLAELRDEGVITAAEFEAKKTRLLDCM
jgi:hypothetical protein